MRTMIGRMTSTAAALAVALGTSAAFSGAPAASERAILDSSGTLWRSMVGWKTPVVLTTNNQVRLLRNQQYFWMPAEDPAGKTPTEWQSKHPAGGWNLPEFDDSAWDQSSGPQGPGFQPKSMMWWAGCPAQVNVVCSRAKFKVGDPAKVGTLKLAIRYQGGAVVYVNGTEVSRLDLPIPGKAVELQAQPDFDTLATAYPDDVYLDSDGKAIGGDANPKSTPEQRTGFDKRIRRLEADIPATLLRPGVNVLAIEIHRAPYKEIYMGAPHDYHGKLFRDWPSPWPHCRLVETRLTASEAGDGVTANIGRPADIQVWCPHPLATLTGLNYGDPCETIPPLRLIGFRNGAFSAQLAVSSTNAIEGLTVTATDLAGSLGGKVAASAVLLCYPEPTDNGFDALLNKAPAPVAVRQYRASREAPVQKVAMQPVWVTVKVPGDAQPGDYWGKVRIAAQGLAAVEIPLSVKVHDWCLPNPKDLVAHNNLWQSHESVAARYKVPLWSDRHFELMGQCLELTAPLANKFCNVHLVKGAFCIGNTQSMVRWIDKGEGRYDYDFMVFDKYLDLHERKLGKPKVLLMDVCVSIHSSSRSKDGTNPVEVSRLDPASGAVEPMAQPPYASATGVPFWKPVLDQVKARLEKRGWWDVALLGTASDSGPTPDEAETFKQIWPDKAWLFSGHPDTKTVGGKVAAQATCVEWVWGAGNIWNPAGGENYRGGSSYPAPWKRTNIISVAFPRLGAGACELYGHSPLTSYRLNPEKAMQCGQDGIGRVGINFWPFADDKGRWRQLDFGQGTGQFFFNNAVPWFLGAGPDGPVPTTRSEMFREGLQIREAMTFLQRAADSGKLPPDVVARIGDLLRQRAANMLQADGQREWRENEDMLFALCAEASKATGGQ